MLIQNMLIKNIIFFFSHVVIFSCDVAWPDSNNQIYFNHLNAFWSFKILCILKYVLIFSLMYKKRGKRVLCHLFQNQQFYQLCFAQNSSILLVHCHHTVRENVHRLLVKDSAGDQKR